MRRALHGILPTELVWRTNVKEYLGLHVSVADISESQNLKMLAALPKIVEQRNMVDDI